MLEYPEEMQLPPDVDVEIAILSWHINGHGPFCQNNYSLNYLPGVGRTCGEDIEISWSHTNSLAPSVREMGPGARRETLNDHWNGWNFHKIVGFRKFVFLIPIKTNPTVSLGQLFFKCFKDAVQMKKKHQEAFELFSSSFSPPTINKWSRMVQEWQDDHTKPNPYEEPFNSESYESSHIFKLSN